MDPDNLYDTACNLANGDGSLGIGTRITERNFASDNGASPSVAGESQLESLFSDIYQLYHHGKDGYGNSVVTNARSFEPNQNGNIFTAGGQQ